MKKALFHCGVAFAAGIALSSCASAPSNRQTAKTAPVEQASDAKPYDFRLEGKIPPLTSADAPNEPDVEEIGITETAIDVTDAEAPLDTVRQAAPAQAQTALVDGFRVQVFATADREIAENAARVATERLALPGYVDLDGGVYKVRMGDFATRPEADQALSAVRRQYTDAWVVASKVRAVAKGP